MMAKIVAMPAGQQAATLKSLAETFRIPVVVVNQVTAQVYAPATHAFQGQTAPAGQPAQTHLTAALGTMWAHAVNTRLVLESVADVRYIKVSSAVTLHLVLSNNSTKVSSVHWLRSVACSFSQHPAAAGSVADVRYIKVSSAARLYLAHPQHDCMQRAVVAHPKQATNDSLRQAMGFAQNTCNDRRIQFAYGRSGNFEKPFSQQ